MPGTIALDTEEDEIFDMANLSEVRTGIPGVVWISTRVARPGPRVNYFEKAGSDQHSFSVSIADAPEVVANSLPERVVKRMSPEVIEWAGLNRAALLEFWNRGDSWMDEEVEAFKQALVRLPYRGGDKARLPGPLCLGRSYRRSAQQSALLDGIYLVIDENHDDAIWVRYRHRDDFEAVLPQLLIALRFAHAEAEIDEISGSPVIVVELTSVDRERFGRITSKHVGERLAVIVEGFVVTAPVIVEPIWGGHLQISGDFTLEEAAELVRRLVAREKSDRDSR